MPSMSSTAVLPFSGEDVEEVPLAKSPLVLTLIQARFAEHFALSNSSVAEETVATFGRLISGDFPGFQTQNVVNFELSPTGVSPQATGASQWVFTSSDEQWQLTLTRDFMTLSTFKYLSRDDLISRWIKVAAALLDSVPLSKISRIGVRYVNRFSVDSGFGDVDRYFRDELKSFSPDFVGAELTQSITDLFFATEPMGLHARAGLVPSGVVFDPSIEPLTRPSWVFDLDAFDQRPFEFDLETVKESVERLARASYKFFRWGTTEAFLADHRA